MSQNTQSGIDGILSTITDKAKGLKDNIQNYTSTMSPEVKNQIMRSLMFAGGGGLLGALLTGSYPGESGSERRSRMIRNALLSALLAGGASYMFTRGKNTLTDALKKTPEEIANDKKVSDTMDLGTDALAGLAGGGLAGLGAYGGGKLLNAFNQPGRASSAADYRELKNILGTNDWKTRDQLDNALNPRSKLMQKIQPRQPVNSVEDLMGLRQGDSRKRLAEFLVDNKYHGTSRGANRFLRNAIPPSGLQGKAKALGLLGLTGYGAYEGIKAKDSLFS